MKTVIGYMDLIFAMVFLIIGLPIIVICIRSSESYKYTYLSDKSTFEIHGTTIDEQIYNTETKKYIKSTSPVKVFGVDVSGVIFMPYVGDDLAIGSQKVAYCEIPSTNEKYKFLDLTNGWGSVHAVKTKDIITKIMGVNAAARNNYYVNNIKDDALDSTQFSLSWDKEKQAWILSTKPILLISEGK